MWFFSYFLEWKDNCVDISSNELCLPRDPLLPFIIEALVFGGSILQLTRDPSIRTAIMSSTASIGSKPVGLKSESDSILDIDSHSFGWNDAFSIEMTLSLRLALYGVLEIGIVIDASLKGKFLGMDIPKASEEYMVVRVIKILPFAKDIFVMLLQHDCLVLSNIVNKVVLWRVEDMDFPLENPPINVVGVEVDAELSLEPFVPLEK